MAKKFYYVAAQRQGALGAIVPVQLASCRTYSRKINAERECKAFQKKCPGDLFLVSWQWDNDEGMNEYLKMANRGYFNEKNNIGFLILDDK